MRRIPESEYVAHLNGALQEVADKIAASGLSHNEIARETRMSRSTVYAAANCRPVSVVNILRIIYFLNQYHGDRT